MRVDWCVSSWFRIKNTHSRRLGPGVGVRFGWVAAQGAGFACGGGQGGVGALQGGSARRCGPPGPPERLQHLGAAAAGGRAGCGR